METYTLLREFADSWMLLAMTLFFVAMILWTLRPSAKARHEDISRIPLRNEDAPLGADLGGADGRNR
ncbi:MAG: cbb3-type cytochrome c oxidase subunit 3 [Pseudomonadota bacterium]